MARARTKTAAKILSLSAAYDGLGGRAPMSWHAFQEMAKHGLVPGQLPIRGPRNAYQIDAIAFAARAATWALRAQVELSKERSDTVQHRKGGLTIPGRSSHVRRQRRAYVEGAAKRFLEAPNLHQVRAVLELLHLVPAGDDAPITITIVGEGEPVVYRASRKKAWAEYDRAKLRGASLDEIIFD